MGPVVGELVAWGTYGLHGVGCCLSIDHQHVQVLLPERFDGSPVVRWVSIEALRHPTAQEREEYLEAQWASK